MKIIGGEPVYPATSIYKAGMNLPLKFSNPARHL